MDHQRFLKIQQANTDRPVIPGVTPQPMGLRPTVEMPDYRGPIESQLPSEPIDEASGAIALNVDFEVLLAETAITRLLQKLSLEARAAGVTDAFSIGRTTMAELSVVAKLNDLDAGVSALRVSLVEAHRNPKGYGRQWFSFNDFAVLPEITAAYTAMAARRALEARQKETDELIAVRARETNRDAVTQNWETYPWIGIGDGKIDLSSPERLWKVAVERTLIGSTSPEKSAPIFRALVNDHTRVLVTRRNGQLFFHRYVQEGVDLKSESAWSMNP